MTETSGTTHFRSPDKETVPGSVGVLLSNLECKVGRHCITSERR